MSKLNKIHPNSAGIDIGSEKIFVSTNGSDVLIYDTFTSGFNQCAKALNDLSIKSVAMEATGVYWIVLYDILTKAGFDVWLVNGAEVKNLPGRKSDIKDCQWIQQLHSFGLLNRCFIPDDQIRELRCYMRLRDDHVQMASSHILHIQKAYLQMGIRLHQVISDTMGASGIRILESILSGQRDPLKLVDLCDVRITAAKRALIVKSLEGNYKEEYLFALQQAYNCWKFYQVQIQECDQKIDQLLQVINKDKADQVVKHDKKIKHDKTSIAKLDQKLIKLTEGRNAIRISGISEYTLLQLISEIGYDLSRWKSVKHFVSYLKLSPQRNSSGKSSKRVKVRLPKAGQVLKQACQGLLNSKHNALGDFGRRIRSRKGPAVAVKAMARKLATMYYMVMTKGTEYVESGIEKYQEKIKSQKVAYLTKMASEFNLTLTPSTPTC